jgi:hypothetical protein
MSQEMITLRLREYGEYSVRVPRAEYESAKANDDLENYLDVEAGGVLAPTVIIEPDGTEFTFYD